MLDVEEKRQFQRISAYQQRQDSDFDSLEMSQEDSLNKIETV